MRAIAYIFTVQIFHDFRPLTLLGPQSRFGDKPLKFQVLCPPKRDCGSKVVKKSLFLIRTYIKKKNSENDVKIVRPISESANAT